MTTKTKLPAAVFAGDCSCNNLVFSDEGFVTIGIGCNWLQLVATGELEAAMSELGAVSLTLSVTNSGTVVIVWPISKQLEYTAFLFLLSSHDSIFEICCSSFFLFVFYCCCYVCFLMICMKLVFFMVEML